MTSVRRVVAFSGGKDSTALVLRYAEKGIPFEVLYTSTGNELPEVKEHIERIVDLVDVNMVDIQAPTLLELIREQQCLPNWRMRWCTRMIKIEPCQRWLRDNPGVRLAVGLRADEPGRAGGTYGDLAEIVYPLRDWGWGLDNVSTYCSNKGINIPKRTDCAWCFYQTLPEWKELWQEHLDLYLEAELLEEEIGHTFRSPQRDSWPAPLRDLRALFEKGKTIRARKKRERMCRVCSM